MKDDALTVEVKSLHTKNQNQNQSCQVFFQQKPSEKQIETF